MKHLRRSNQFHLTCQLASYFKTTDDSPIVVNSIQINEAVLTLKTDRSGHNNYDITKEVEEKSDINKDEAAGFSLNIEDYTIKNSTLTFTDEASNTYINVSDLNHSGHGIFSAELSELDTKSEAKVSITVDSSNYLNQNTIKLEAIIGLDLSTNKFTFKNNKGYINELPLEFKGYVQLLENAQEIDLTFENPESSFKDFLAVIPKAYSKNIDAIETTGNFKVSGFIKGLISDQSIPNFDINITSKNASFKYPNLPKQVENISINTTIKNTTGNIDDTFVSINTLNFKIDEDVFKSSATLRSLTKNMLVNANIDGTLNLNNLNQAYPIELDHAFSGILKAKINTSFDMKALETDAYERIKTNGTMQVNDFIYSSEDIVNPIHISKAQVTFKPKTITLNNLSAKTGESDFNASGTLKNLLGFLLSDNTLQGHFNVTSNHFSVSDFMVEDTTDSASNKTTTESESLKIPAFLDCSIVADAKEVLYDNLILTNVKGMLIIKNQEAFLKDVSSNLFDGQLAIEGKISTTTEIPTFDLNLNANSFDISKSFKDLELLQNLAPIAKLIDGKFNTQIKLKGSLDKEFSPNLDSVSGDALAELMTNNIKTNEDGLLKKLEGTLSFIDFNKLDLKDLKTRLEFADGQVSVKPFQIKYEDISIEVSGSHSFDQTMNYTAVFNVPASYLGTEVNQLINKIDEEDVKTLTVPVTSAIAGSYSNPSVSTDLTNGITNLTRQLIEIEKKKLLNKGKGKIDDLLDGLLNENSPKSQISTSDSTKANTPNTTKDPIKEGVKNILGGLLSGKKKKKDTIN